ncbi:hypothetical protein ACTXT7_014711 [Hymenolepis weldensis]
MTSEIPASGRQQIALLEFYDLQVDFPSGKKKDKFSMLPQKLLAVNSNYVQYSDPSFFFPLVWSVRFECLGQSTAFNFGFKGRSLFFVFTAAFNFDTAFVANFYGLQADIPAREVGITQVLVVLAKKYDSSTRFLYCIT